MFGKAQSERKQRQKIKSDVVTNKGHIRHAHSAGQAGGRWHILPSTHVDALYKVVFHRPPNDCCVCVCMCISKSTFFLSTCNDAQSMTSINRPEKDCPQPKLIFGLKTACTHTHHFEYTHGRTASTRRRTLKTSMAVAVAEAAATATADTPKMSVLEMGEIRCKAAQ